MGRWVLYLSPHLSIASNFVLVQYCPEKAMFICDSFANGRGLFQRFRMSGFSLFYTQELLTVIFGDSDSENDLDFLHPSEPAWPPVPAPYPYKFDPPLLANSSTSARSIYEITLSRSPSFAKSFEEELSSRSPLSETHIFESMNAIIKEEDSDGLRSPGVKLHDDACLPCGILDRANVGTSSLPPDNDNSGTKSTDGTADGTACLTPTSSHASRVSSPSSPNTMNKKNEKDPAFLRTLQALQSTDLLVDTQAKPRPLSYPSPQRPKFDALLSGLSFKSTPGGSTRSESSKKRYMMFLNRLRGRAVTN